jgi:pimeloyl-ACP methyl ester carboxylesterase
VIHVPIHLTVIPSNGPGHEGSSPVITVVRLFVVGLVLSLQLQVAPASASRVAGSWVGTLNAGAIRVRVVFLLKEEPPGHLLGTMDSPDQGARGIPLSGVRFEGDSLWIEAQAVGGGYAGVLLPGDTLLVGTWSQSGLRLPLALRPGLSPEAARRAQDPVPPFPYHQEEVVFNSREPGITLAGTLTMPPVKTPVPAVVLISGSGPQDRNETVFGHRPFLVLADALTRRGIAVLRYDDRGVGGSGGTRRDATVEDFALDADGAVAFLASRPEIDPHRIGLIGHSEGGLLGSMVAAEDSETIAFLVLLASPGVPGEDLLLLQTAALARASGASEEAIGRTLLLNRSVYAVARAGKDSATVARDAAHLLRSWADSLSQQERASLGDFDTFLSRQLATITSPWFRSFLTQDPRAVLHQVHCPVLALTGSKDLQVPPAENLSGIRTALHEAGNIHAVVRELPGLNHLLQTAATGLPSEYSTLEETIAPAALSLIGEWITSVTAVPTASPSDRP